MKKTYFKVSWEGLEFDGYSYTICEWNQIIHELSIIDDEMNSQTKELIDEYDPCIKIQPVMLSERQFKKIRKQLEANA